MKSSALRAAPPIGLESCATDKTSVDVLLCEEFDCVRRFAAASVEDGQVFSDRGTELLLYNAADASMDLLCLLCRGGLAGTDGPYRLIGDDDIGHILGRELVEDVHNLFLDDIEMPSFFPLGQVLAYAEDHLETCSKSKLHLLDELLIGLTIILPSLGMTEDGVGTTYGSKHISRNLTCVGTLGVVCAVLGGEDDLGTLQDFGYGCQMGERRSDYQLDVGRKILGLFNY